MQSIDNSAIAEPMLCVKLKAGAAHFYPLSYWDLLDAVKEFAGRDEGKSPILSTEDKEFWLEFESSVPHLEVIGEG